MTSIEIPADQFIEAVSALARAGVRFEARARWPFPTTPSECDDRR